ncbi:sensor histidine kinase [Tenacibaculum aiptasiae]|uniref:sensor histidine kinase n=1 Tax=Tenacibaculum aiptasiae TaxID=426481 RepID=UPI00232C29E9|nr:HAMP domain-containing sensor histidine kinase [Tenacibaculum aiptasiae]
MLIRFLLTVNARLTVYKHGFLQEVYTIFGVMKGRINILIIVSIIAIVTLSTIQYSLIKNTFTLQRDLFFNEVKKDLAFIETDDSPDWDTKYLVELKKDAQSYKEGKITKGELLKNFSLHRDSINKEFVTYFEEKIRTKKLLFPVDFQKEITSVILLGEVNDTILNNESVLLYGKELNPKTRFFYNKSDWETVSKTVNEGSEKNNIGFKIKTRSYIDIINWKSEIFKRMFWVLLLSFLSIIVVIGLFTYALYNLVKQKKNADIKTDFVNNITHELKTPLATLSIATKTLQQKNIADNKEMFQSVVSTINRQRVRLQNLIDQVVNNSLGFEQINLQKENVVIQYHLKNLIDDYKIQKEEVTISFEYSEPDINLNLDVFHFNTAILNLLDNAIKYGEDIIDIRLKNENNHGVLIIKDNGIGIAKKDHKKIFDKFYRVNNTTIHNVKGLGLGLYYVKQIVKAHQGAIQLDSELEKGTTITIKIPV